MPPPLTFRKHCLEATYMGGGKEKLNEFEIQSVGPPQAKKLLEQSQTASVRHPCAHRQIHWL